jgi:Ca2+-binding RTX toxin-like protein
MANLGAGRHSVWRASAALALVATAIVGGGCGGSAAPAGQVEPSHCSAGEPYCQSVIAKKPAMYWRLNERSGTTVRDASGNHRAGTISGTVDLGKPGGTSDRGDRAISLDGSSGYIRADSYAPFAPGSKRTFVLLFKRDAPQDGIRNIFAGSGTYDPGVSDDLKTPVLEFASAPASGIRWYGSIRRQFPNYNDWRVQTAARKWMQLVLTVDDTAGKAGLNLWIDGARLGPPSAGADSSVGWDPEAGRFLLGNHFTVRGVPEATEWADNTYDEVAIFDRILTDDEIRDLAAAAGARRPSPSPPSGSEQAPGAASTTAPLCDGSPATRVGTNDPDRIIGTAGPDVVVALGGNDSVSGLGGDDKICGGTGGDVLRGGGGKDDLLGGPGRDTQIP